MKTGFLGSGRLGYEVLEKVFDSIRPVFIATDRKSADIIAFAKRRSIPLFEGNPRGGALAQFLLGVKTDVIFSVNYLFLIEKDVLDLVTHVINLHGSLLPKYRGRTPHVWAIINNEKVSGVTAHIVDEGCDTGPVVLQQEIPIGMHDTGADVLARFSALYPEIVLAVFENLRTGKLKPKEQDQVKATYFGKRTPDDGLIDWNWQKERIYNWVRAQAAPYPGAFSLLGSNRVIIDRVAFNDGGFSYDEPNGLIKCTSPFLVKTPNGLLEIQVIREGKDYLERGKIFNG